MNSPVGVAFDSFSKHLCVAEVNNHRVTMFDVSTTTIANGENAVNVVGQTDGDGNGVYTTNVTYHGAVQQGVDYAYDVVVDTTSHRLFVADYFSRRVLVYELDARNILVDRTPDHLLGQSDFVHTSIWGNPKLQYDFLRLGL